MDEAAIRLVIGEGVSFGIWGGYCSNDERDRSGEGIGWGTESVFKASGLACLTAGEGWSFEGGWEGGKAAAVVEVLEKAFSHCGHIAHVEASSWEACQRAVSVEGVEKVVSS